MIVLLAALAAVVPAARPCQVEAHALGKLGVHVLDGAAGERAASLRAALHLASEPARVLLRCELLGDVSPVVRAAAARRLGEAMDPGAATALVEATGDAFLEPAEAATRALARIRPEAVLPPVMAALSALLGVWGKDGGLVAAAQARRLLRVLEARGAGDPAAGALVGRVLERAGNGEGPVAGAIVERAVAAAGALGDPALLRWVVRATLSAREGRYGAASGGVARAGALALVALGDPSSAPLLDELALGHDAVAAGLARRALRRLGMPVPDAGVDPYQDAALDAARALPRPASSPGGGCGCRSAGPGPRAPLGLCVLLAIAGRSARRRRRRPTTPCRRAARTPRRRPTR